MSLVGATVVLGAAAMSGGATMTHSTHRSNAMSFLSALGTIQQIGSTVPSNDDGGPTEANICSILAYALIPVDPGPSDAVSRWCLPGQAAA
jgi:hypothetical protein